MVSFLYRRLYRLLKCFMKGLSVSSTYCNSLFTFRIGLVKASDIFYALAIMDIYEEVGKPLQGRAIYVTIGLPYFF